MNINNFIYYGLGILLISNLLQILNLFSNTKFLLGVDAYNTIKLDNSNLLPLYYNIGLENRFKKNILNKLKINGNDYCLYYADNKWNLLSDVCIHRGASLSSSKTLKYSINNNFSSPKCIRCPYHGWEYIDGRLSKIPGNINNYFNIGVQNYPVKTHNNDLYVTFSYEQNSNTGLLPSDIGYDLFDIEEETNNNFEKITKTIQLPITNEIVIENLLDMMHVSYIHSFGNSLQPVPYGIKFQKINDFHGKTSYYYSSGPSSLSRWFGLAEEVIVENEFYLPSTTVTRIKANFITKTILTYSYPIDANNTMLYIKLYRNYLKGFLGDLLHQKQLSITLDEDIAILKNVYEKYSNGIINTKYDITQSERRKFIKKIHNIITPTGKKNETK